MFSLPDPSPVIADDDRLMTRKQTAKMLGISVSTLGRAVVPAGAPTLPFVRMGRRTIRYRRSDVLAYLNACTTT